MTRAVLVALALAVLAGPVAAQVPDDNLIIPGVRIGKWTLEMTLDDLIRQNGNPQILVVEDVDIKPDSALYFWRPLGLMAVVRARRVLYLEIWQSANYQTERGVKYFVGKGRVLAAYGAPTASTKPGSDTERLIYDGIGLAAIIGPDGVLGIEVFRPGSAPEIWKF